MVYSDDNRLENTDEFAKKIIRDTFKFGYRFEVGDTLLFAAMSKDSISINWGDPLLRLRFEKIMLTCDSITKEGHFVVKQHMLSFDAKEYNSDDTSFRKSTPWTNAFAYIEIDTLGRRYRTWNSDSSIAVIPPGGPFQHFILLPLGSHISDNATTESIDNVKAEGESWIVQEELFFVPENGIPNPVYRPFFYYRFEGFIDTLDLGQMLKMTYAMTSQSSLQLHFEGLQNRTTSINNSGGEVFWDTNHWVPKFAFMTIEQRLTIEDKSSNQKDTGFHFINTTFVLEKFIRKSKEIKIRY